MGVFKRSDYMKAFIVIKQSILTSFIAPAYKMTGRSPPSNKFVAQTRGMVEITVEVKLWSGRNYG